ncbi:MAG: phosphoribosyl-ATP diphosphatase [Myxococcota bacterium]|nr:phosphoribosyl-ATP diphosphatase [Myxococcota bacterium]
MIVPSIDIMNGQAVQLIGGETHALDAGDPMILAERFSRVGPIAVIDLDAALGIGENSAIIAELCKRFRCRVGGGIRSIEAAKRWLDAGAEQIIIGTCAKPEFLKQLPKGRCIAALDAKNDEVVVHGWQTSTGERIEACMEKLNPYVAGYLVTFVEREGRMGGTRLERVPDLIRAAGGCTLTIAGGVTTASEVAKLDDLGADAQIGMALYTGQLGLAEAFAAPMKSDRTDGLWPTVVVDEYQRALGLCYSNLQSVTAALETGCGVYWSRRRGLWKKGESSGNTQTLLRVDADCDRDTLRFTVRQTGSGFCHLDTDSCWGPIHGLPGLAQTLAERKHSAPKGSYTKRLLTDPALLKSKLLEEAQELIDAQTPEEAVWETADVLYFTLVAMTSRGGKLEDVIRMLAQRTKQINKRPGNAKSTRRIS